MIMEFADLMGPVAPAVAILLMLTIVSVAGLLLNSMYEDHVQEQRRKEIEELRRG